MQNRSDNLKEIRSVYLRTTLDERVNAICGGNELIPITALPRILPISYQTIKNQISLKKFQLHVIRFNNKNFVRTEDVVRLISDSSENHTNLRKRVGRKSNKEKAITASFCQEKPIQVNERIEDMREFEDNESREVQKATCSILRSEK